MCGQIIGKRCKIIDLELGALFQAIYCRKGFVQMGSLMAGWDSPVPDPKSVKFSRNRSLTKGEIDAYWRSKKKIEEEHLKAISALPDSGPLDVTDEDYEVKLQRSSSLPSANTKAGFVEVESSEASLEQLIKKNGWWTRSNWAFLNEPPVLERSSNNYAPQFHIANLATSKADTGISAQ